MPQRQLTTWNRLRKRCKAGEHRLLTPVWVPAKEQARSLQSKEKNFLRLPKIITMRLVFFRRTIFKLPLRSSKKLSRPTTAKNMLQNLNLRLEDAILGLNSLISVLSTIRK